MKSEHWLLLLVGVALVIWFYKRQSASSGSEQAFTGTAADPAVAELESSLAAVNKELERLTEKTTTTTP